MKLYEGDTYWDKSIKKDFGFKELKENVKTNTLIIGGGISGTICAYILASNGIEVTVIDKGQIGKGSTLANTGLLQYCSDKMLNELIDSIGEEKAVSFYKMCLEAMGLLTSLSKNIGVDIDYRERESIYYASNENDIKKLKREYEYLKKYNFPVEFLDNEELKQNYKIDKQCALRTWMDADVNPLKFIYAITKKNEILGVSYYENTEVDLDNICKNKIFTNTGHEIQYDNIVLATGYSNLYPIIQDKAEIHRTYAFCSKPMEEPIWKDDVMIWETKKPYYYFRTTFDSRIIAGGLDEEVDKVEVNVEEIYNRAKKITSQIKTIFPNLNIEIDYAWNGLFGGSKDGLPFIGQDPKQTNKYYLLAYEGNGTCYSMAGALIIKDLINEVDNPYKDIVDPNRKI